MTAPSPKLGELARALQRGFALQLGRRAPLLLICDTALVVSGLVGALLRGGDPALVYIAVVQAPILVLGAAALADILEIERRAGSLDLALALPAGERYFAARAAAVCLPLALQSTVVILLLWVAEGEEFPLFPALGAAFLLVAMVGAAVLFWATRVHSPGAVWLASVASVGLLGRWALANPIPERFVAAGAFFGRPEDLFNFAANTFTVGLVLVLMVLATRRRLARSEHLLS